MMTWLHRLFRRPQINETAKQAECIIETARNMRGTMLHAAKESRVAQREERRYKASRDFADTMAIAPVWKRKGGRDD